MSNAAVSPLISVVMPVYNGIDTLERAVGSVRRQTFSDWELLAVDDGSTDGSAEAVAQMAAEEPRIRPLRQPENRGVGATRNVGLEHARGEWAAYLDQDDEYHPLHLENVAALRHKGDVLVFCYDVLFPPAPDGSRRLYTWNPAVVRPRMFCDNIGTPLGVVHRWIWSERVGGFNPLLWLGEDYDLWRRLARAGAKFAYLPLVCGRYHVRQSSQSRMPRTSGYQRRHLEENFQAGRPLYGEPKGTPPRPVRKIACATPHCLLDTAAPAMAALAGALRLLGGCGFSCRAFCGSWLGMPGASGPEDVLTRQGLSYTPRTAVIDGRHYRLLDTRLGEVPVTVFEDAPLTGRWSGRSAPRDFLAAYEHFLDEDRPDAVLSFGEEAVSAALIAAAKQRDIPVIHWLCEQQQPDLRFFNPVDYVVVRSESRRQELWGELGLACHALPDAGDASERDRLAPLYVAFFHDVCPQTGPPYMPRDPESRGGGEFA